MKLHIGSEVNFWYLLVDIFSCSEMMWKVKSIYEIIHICTEVVDESEEWSSQ